MGKIQEKREALIEKLSQEMEANGGLMRTSQLYELSMDSVRSDSLWRKAYWRESRAVIMGWGF